MKAYKGFTKDMKCRDFQFVEGETYHEDTAKLCEHGFHACEDPIDCFGYYSPAESVYHEVELDDVSDEREDDSKVVAKTIKIGSEVSLFGIAKAHVDYVISKVKDNKKKAAHKTDYRSAATNTGCGYRQLRTPAIGPLLRTPAIDRQLRTPAIGPLL